MLGKSLLIFACILVLSGSAFAEKKRDWQTGKLLDTDQAKNYVGSIGNGSVNGTANGNQVYGSTNSSSTAIYKTYQTYIIDAGTYVYIAQERLRWKWSKPATLTVNGPVKYVLDKNKVYVLGEDEKEHEAELLKKILKTPEGQKQ